MENGGRWAPVAQKAVQQDLRTMLRGAVRTGLELFLEQELGELIRAEWYARVDGRRDHRNRHYGRQVLTSLGRVEVAVPRARVAALPTGPPPAPGSDALRGIRMAGGVAARSRRRSACRPWDGD